MIDLSYYTFWSLVVIVIGLVVLLFNQSYIRLLAAFFELLHEKIKFPLFKNMAEQAGNDTTKLSSIIIAVVLLLLGVRVLFWGPF